MTAVAATAQRSGRQLQAGLGAEEYNNKKKRSNKKISALNDGNGKQKLMKPALSDRRMTRDTSKQQQRIQEFPGFDVGDVPLNGSSAIIFLSLWTENSRDPAPKKYEDMAKIGLETYNCQNDTLYQFTKILSVDALTKSIYVAYHITFQAEDESSLMNFEAKAASIHAITMVPFCKLEKTEGDRKQTETLSDLACSVFMEKQEERQRLLTEENRRLMERRGFDFGDIPPIERPKIGTYEPCWSESSSYPAPKLYEDMSEIGIKTYNYQNRTSYQFTKLLKVYFCKIGKGKRKPMHISRFIFFQAEDTSVASPKNFQIQVEYVPDMAVVSNCWQEGRGPGDDRTTGSDCYWSSAIHYDF